MYETSFMYVKEKEKIYFQKDRNSYWIITTVNFWG